MKNASLIFVLTLLFTNIQLVRSQSTDILVLNSSEFIKLSYDINVFQIILQIDQLPEDMEFSKLLMYRTDGTLLFGYELQHEGQRIQQNQSEDFRYSSSDTFAVVIYSSHKYIKYPTVFISSEHKRKSSDGALGKVSVGADCYLLDCPPLNDPWMPSTYTPELMNKHNFYVNPKNGNIRKGNWLINSGYYDICELHKWIPIYTQFIYHSTDGKQISGSSLIKRRKVNLSNWKLNYKNDGY